jgi:dTDP-4-amino-4,6-dideoxygalactose transaminase
VIESKMIRVPFVDLAAQHAAIAEEVGAATTAALWRTDYILGRDVALFEQEFAAYCEAAHAIGVDSGTSALELILRAYDIGPGDEVITVANTFMATALAISYTGATPVLVDIDPQTYTLDVSLLSRAIGDRTRAIIPVHLYGQPADMDPILDLARRRGLVVIEDACQAHGARYKGRRVGSLADAAAFSFYPAKNLGAYGDGGMIVTNDERLAASARMLRNYGQREKYHHVVRGYNRRLDTLQASALRIKLKHLDSWNARRRQHADRYRQLLDTRDVVAPQEAGYAESVWHLFVVRAAERDALAAALASCGIATGIHYPVPVHLQPAYSDLGYRRGDFPVTERYADQILSLPMYAELTDEIIEYVADSLKGFAMGHGNELLNSVAVGI